MTIVSTMRRAGLAVALAGLAAAPAAQAGTPLRLTPLEISGMALGGPGAGSSGVAGIQTTVLQGDPTKPGPYTIALHVPAHTTIAAHSHRDERSAVVVSGTWWFGYGDKADPAGLKLLRPGSFYTEPAGVAHFARTGDEPVVAYISGFGPTDTRYVDPAAAPAAR